MAMFRSLANAFKDFNNRIVRRSGFSSKVVVGFEVTGLLGFGGLMLDLEIYCIAVAAWVAVGIIAVAKICEWQTTSRFLRFAAIIAAIIVCTLLITATNIKRGDNAWCFPKKCEISIDVSSNIMAVVHSRAKWKNHGRTTDVYKPLFQDLFHEWVINVTPSGDAAQIVISINDAREPLDKIRVTPPQNVVVSEPKPGWVSGFEEPTHVPDFYVRTVTFPTLSEPATITIRKPIKSHFGENRISTVDLDLDRQVSASAYKCLVKVTSISATSRPLSDANPHFPELMQEMKALIAQHVAGGPAPTRLDPDEPYPPLDVEESDMVTEVHCKTVQCTELIVTMAEKTRVQ